MVGPVLYQEMLLGSRRSRWHWIRWIYFAWLLLILLPWLLFYFVIAAEFNRRPPDLRDLAAFGEYYVNYLIFQHFLLLLLITPILVAGAITDEKWRGTLQYLLTTDLHPWEILVGKLAARLYQGLLLGLIALPLVSFFGVFAGLDLARTVGLVCCTALLLFAVGALSLLASVWCRHTRDAVLSVYCAGVAALILVPLVELLTDRVAPGALGALREYVYPLYPLGGNIITMPLAEYGRRFGIFTAFWGSFGLGCLLVASWRLRRAYTRQLEKSGRERKRRWWNLRRPGIGNHPLLWKERYVEGIAPLAILRRVPTWLGVVGVFALTVASSGWILLDRLPYGTSPADVWRMVWGGDWHRLWLVRESLDSNYGAFLLQGWVVLLLASLVIGIRCSGAVTGEREKRTWEALLLTPIETRHLIRGKVWGIVGAFVPYLLAYSLPALGLAAVGSVAALFWTVFMLGITLLAIFYVAAAGIWWSVRSQTSWRSLLGTLASTYVGGAILWAALSFVSLFIATFVIVFLALAEAYLERYTSYRPGLMRSPVVFFNVWNIGVCILLAVSFFVASWMMIRNAEYRVAILERTKHWKDEQRYESRRRRRRRRSQPVLED